MKMEFEASDKKKGMSLAEVYDSVRALVERAEHNGTALTDAKVSVMVNMKAGIKSLTGEV